jgi:pyruvate/2-oxoglutarate/acetoin dehydrogenase E1 component
MVGAALGMWLAGRSVVVDVMFTGFLSRCVEPLTVGFETARRYASDESGWCIIRALDSPVGAGDPSHDGMLAGLLESVSTMRVIHVVDHHDVSWALATHEPSEALLLLLETPDPAAFLDAEMEHELDGLTVRLLRSGGRSATVLTNNWMPLARRQPHHHGDLVSLPSATELPSSLLALLSTYEEVSVCGVQQDVIRPHLPPSVTLRAVSPG